MCQHIDPRVLGSVSQGEVALEDTQPFGPEAKAGCSRLSP